MSLIKQLWIAIALVTSLSFGGSLVVSTLAAQRYLEQQLDVKNMDNATSLALSLSQMPKDPVTVELQIAAQFDAGHYRRIDLVAPDGSVMVTREYDGVRPKAPDWFMRLVPITPRPGVAQVQDGWHQFGTLTLESHSRYAYEALWVGTQQMLLWFIIGAVATGLIGTSVLKFITRPLDLVVAQAEAIGGRRFIITPEPATREFRSVVRAMNTLSGRVQTMMEEEAARLEQLRRQTQLDPLTQLYNREQFFKRVDTALEREDEHAGGALLIARIGDLAELNRRLGRAAADVLLAGLAARLQTTTEQTDWTAGRLNGTDLALLAPDAEDPANLAANLAAHLHTWLDADPQRAPLALPVGACAYTAGEARAELLARVDGALAAAEQAGPRAQNIAVDTTASTRLVQTQWRDALKQALAEHGVRLGSYPAISATTGQVLHFEAPARLHLDGEWRTAGYFMPWAARQDMTGAVDLAVVRAALAQIAADDTQIGINLSPETLRDAAHRGELFALLQQSPAQARKLWIELPAHGALRHAAEFRALCVALHPLGCQLGIEHVGATFTHIAELHNLGLDYVKVDTAIIRGIDSDTGNQTILRGLCTLAHSIGMLIIAEGVATDAERECLPRLGVDGMTGPAIRLT